jgi:hypothetical protein
MSDEEDIKEQIELMGKTVEMIIPKIATYMKTLREELIKNGFSRKEAIAICTQYKMTGDTK